MATAQQEIKKDNNAKTLPTPQSFWDRFIGKALVIQTKGRIIITGTFREYTSNHFLVFDNPVIKGTRTVKPPEVYIALAQVGHFHEQVELEPKEKTNAPEER